MKLSSLAQFKKSCIFYTQILKKKLKIKNQKIKRNRGGNVLRQPRVCNQNMGRRTQIRNSSPQIASSPHTSNKHRQRQRQRQRHNHIRRQKKKKKNQREQS